MSLPRNLAKACKNYDFSYIAGWLNGRCNISVDADIVNEILEPEFILERKLMEADMEFARKKIQEIKARFKRRKIICDLVYPDRWPDGTWRIWLMNRLEERGIFPYSFHHGRSEELQGSAKTARSKIFTTSLFPTPINEIAAKVSGIKKNKKNDKNTEDD